MASEDIFDKKMALKFIWKKLRIINTHSQWDLWKRLWYSQSYVSSIFNWDASLTREKLEEFAIEWVGMTRMEFKDLVVDAKAYEFEQTTWQPITQWDLESIIEKEFWEIDEKTLQEIREFIEFKAKK